MCRGPYYFVLCLFTSFSAIVPFQGSRIFARRVRCIIVLCPGRSGRHGGGPYVIQGLSGCGCTGQGTRALAHRRCRQQVAEECRPREGRGSRFVWKIPFTLRNELVSSGTREFLPFGECGSNSVIVSFFCLLWRARESHLGRSRLPESNR